MTACQVVMKSRVSAYSAYIAKKYAWKMFIISRGKCPSRLENQSELQNLDGAKYNKVLNLYSNLEKQLILFLCVMSVHEMCKHLSGFVISVMVTSKT